MKSVPIRIPEPGETPLSVAEQRIAQRMGIKPPRHYARRFWWRQSFAPVQQPERQAQ